MKKAEQIKIFWNCVRSIPKGKVSTYKELARAAKLNNPRIAGRWLHHNQDPEQYPCHRVVRSDGKLASGYAFGGAKQQAQMLRTEGVVVQNDRLILSDYFVSL